MIPTCEPPRTEPFERERRLLHDELKESQATNRTLLRQLKKAQEATDEARRAHAKMVTTLTETMRENTMLAMERDMWRSRAERTPFIPEQQAVSPGTLLEIVALTEEEVGAIRKAMARLHHPDAGGCTERMKMWNAMLDLLEQSK